MNEYVYSPIRQYTHTHTHKSIYDRQKTELYTENYLQLTEQSYKWKKALRETQTLHARCSRRSQKKFRPAADPLLGGAGPPKFNQLEMVTTFTYTPRLVKIDAGNFELSW